MNYPKTTTLARLFPSLRGAIGVDPVSGLDLLALDEWAMNHSRSDGTVNAARFILHIFDSTRKWKCGAFELVPAIRSWDRDHLAAFQSWAASPFQE